jgi:LacI family transcriptional regulator
VTGPPSREVVRTRLRGLRTGLSTVGLDLPDGNVEVADWTADGGYAAAARLLDRNPGLTALFVQSDTMAVGVLRLLADRGVRVPEQMSVVGCDDLPLSRLLVPSLTTVAVPFVETGARAAAVLLDLIAGRDVPKRQILPVRLVPRASTGPAPTPRARGPSRPRAPAGIAASGTSRHRRNVSANPAPAPARRTSSDDRTA